MSVMKKIGIYCLLLLNIFLFSNQVSAQSSSKTDTNIIFSTGKQLKTGPIEEIKHSEVRELNKEKSLWRSFLPSTGEQISLVGIMVGLILLLIGILLIFRKK